MQLNRLVLVECEARTPDKMRVRATVEKPKAQQQRQPPPPPSAGAEAPATSL